MQRIDRALGILLALRDGRAVAAAELARRFEVSSRTIYRDIDLLSALGVPVYAERGRVGGLRLLPGYFLPPVMFTTGEAVSLVLGLALLRSLRVRPFAAELQTAGQKLLAAVPDALRAIMTDADRLIGVEAVPGDAFHRERTPAADPNIAPDDQRERAMVDGFLQAILQRRQVRLRYQSPVRPAPVDLIGTPLGLFWDRDRWYLAGAVESDTGRGPRLWRADRVISLSIDGPATPPPAFDIRALLGRAWLATAMREWSDEAPVRLRLSRRLADRLAGDWYYRHARYEPLADGTVLMTYGEDDPAAARELIRWLGPEAELLEPVAWRDALRAELATMLATYAGG